MNILTIVRLLAGTAFVCAFLLVLVLPYWKIFRKAGFSPWLSLLIWVPLVNFIILYTVAYSDWKIEPTALKEENSVDRINVRRVVGWFFPWRKLFGRLELEKRWWHRLAIVAFFIALVPMLLFSWAVASDSYRPANTYNSEIHQWQIIPRPPDGYVLDQSTDVSTTALPDRSAIGEGKIAIPIKDDGDWFAKNAPNRPSVDAKTIEMPDGKTATYPGTTSDEAIKTDWQHKLDTEQVEGFVLGITIAVFVTLCFAYLLQFAYRALLYVIYGSKVAVVPSAPENTAPDVQ